MSKKYYKIEVTTIPEDGESDLNIYVETDDAISAEDIKNAKSINDLEDIKNFKVLRTEIIPQLISWGDIDAVKEVEKEDTEETDIVAELEKEEKLLDVDCLENYEAYVAGHPFEVKEAKLKNWDDVEDYVEKGDDESFTWEVGYMRGYRNALRKMKELIKNKENKI